MMNAQVDGSSVEERQRLFKLRLAQKGIVAAQVEPIRRHNSTTAPLSYAQQRLWFLDQLEPDNAAYNLSTAVQLSGHFELPIMARALNEIVRRHEILRTTIAEEHGQPVQVIHTARQVPVPLVDLTALSPDVKAAMARRLANEEANRPFDLRRGPLLRATVLRLAAEDHVGLFTLHHIVTDGWSMEVLVKEFAGIYEAFTNGRPSPLHELPIQYADFAEWQREKLSGPALNSHLSYWKKQLRGSNGLLELPFDRPRPLVQTYHGGHSSLSLPDKLSNDLRSLTQREGCTLFMTLLAAFQILLYRYSGEPDISVGIPVAGRSRPEVQNLIGFFLNTLVVRSKIDGAATFREFMQQVKETAVGAQAHQDVPFELIVEHVQPERSLTHSPLFQVMFNLLNSPEQPIALPGLDLKPFDARQNGSKFDMTLYVTEADAPLDLVLAYNTDLFDASTVDQMLRHFQTLLEGITAEPEIPLSQIPLVTGPELQQLILTWNDTQRDFGPPRSIQALFDLSLARAPHAVAVTCGPESLTYLELDQRVNRLAFRLRQLGAGPEVIVGVCLGRSIEMVVALLAVLKAGGALLQLDLSYPAERLAFMLEDSQVSLLLTRSHLRERFPHYDRAVLCLDEMAPVAEAE